jgi:hypothetical protein
VRDQRRKKIRVGETNARLLDGEEELNDWTMEELLRGRRMDKNGTWRGSPPKVVPMAVHQELTRRTLEEAAELLRESLVPGLEALRNIMLDPDTKAADRIKAIDMVMNRVMGKEPTKVEVTSDSPWIIALQDAIVPGEDDEEELDEDEEEQGS